MNATRNKADRTVLILHHHPETLDHCRALVEGRGFRVITGANGPDAITHIYESVPDLVIADTMLSGINGYQICRLVKNDPALKNIPFVLVSGEQTNGDEKLDRFWGFQVGAEDFLSEAELPDRLADQAEDLLRRFDNIKPYGKSGPSDEKPLLPTLSGTDLVNVRARLTQILDKSLIETTLMVAFRDLSDLIHDRELLTRMIFSLMSQLVEYDLAALFFNDRNREPRVVTFHCPPDRPADSALLKSMKADFFSRVTRLESIPRQFDYLEYDVIGPLTDKELRERSFNTCYFQETLENGGLYGAFALYSEKNRDYNRVFPVSLIEGELRLLMKLRHLYSQAETLAITDGLTGLFNYRHFMQTLDREYRRARRYGHRFSLALVDVDRFKDINDQWGHLAGDTILRKITEQAGQIFRGIDFVARYGGEELAVIFPETPIEKAQVACERFRERVDECVVSWEGQRITATVSIGLAVLTDDMESASDLIRAADTSLYKAKAEGRNRVVTP